MAYRLLLDTIVHTALYWCIFVQTTIRTETIIWARYSGSGGHYLCNWSSFFAVLLCRLTRRERVLLLAVENVRLLKCGLKKEKVWSLSIAEILWIFFQDLKIGNFGSLHIAYVHHQLYCGTMAIDGCLSLYLPLSLMQRASPVSNGGFGLCGTVWRQGSCQWGWTHR